MRPVSILKVLLGLLFCIPLGWTSGVGVGNGYYLYMNKEYGYSLKYPKDWTFVETRSRTTFDNSDDAGGDPKQTSSLDVTTIDGFAGGAAAYASQRQCPACAWHRSDFNGMNGVYTDTDWATGATGIRKSATFVMQWKNLILVLEASVSPSHGGLNWILDMIDSLNREYAETPVAPEGAFVSAWIESPTPELDGTQVIWVKTRDISLPLLDTGRLEISPADRYATGQLPIRFVRVADDLYKGELSLAGWPGGEWRINRLFGQYRSLGGGSYESGWELDGAGTEPLLQFEIRDSQHRRPPVSEWRIQALSTTQFASVSAGDRLSIHYGTNFDAAPTLTADTSALGYVPEGAPLDVVPAIPGGMIQTAIRWTGTRDFWLDVTLSPELPRGSFGDSTTSSLFKVSLQDRDPQLGVVDAQGRPTNLGFVVTNGPAVPKKLAPIKVVSFENLLNRVRCGDDMAFLIHFGENASRFNLSSGPETGNTMKVTRLDERTWKVSYATSCILSVKAVLPEFRIDDHAGGRSVGERSIWYADHLAYLLEPSYEFFGTQGHEGEAILPVTFFENVSPLEW